MLCDCRPAIMVNATITKDFKVLRTVALLGFGVIESVLHTGAFDCILLNTVYATYSQRHLQPETLSAFDLPEAYGSHFALHWR